jgi:hypothetical protein
MMHDQYSHWEQALRTGRAIESGDRANGTFVRAGFFKRNRGVNLVEAIAFWRNEANALCCKRTRPNSKALTKDEIEELYASVSLYPISYEIWLSAQNTIDFEWPPEYRTRLTLDEIKQGLSWTPELGKKKLGVDSLDTPRAVIGGNNPPEELSQDQVILKKMDELSERFNDWLNKLGGEPKTQADADMLGHFANRIKDYENEARAAHAAEKAPFWQKCKEIDAKWLTPVLSRATSWRNNIISLIQAFKKTENERRAEEARLANEAARKAAEQQAKISGEPPAQIDEVVPEKAKVGTLRGGPREPERLISDLGTFLAYCASMNEPPPDIVAAANKVARKWRASGFNAPGMIGKDAA